MRMKRIFAAFIFVFILASALSCSFDSAAGDEKDGAKTSIGSGKSGGTVQIPEGPIIKTSDPRKKRGLCYERLNEAEIKMLAKSDVSWVYNWGTHPTDEEDKLFQEYGIEYIPMQWGLSTEKSLVELRAYYTSHQNSANKTSYILAYNEPNLGGNVGGSGITPADAAKDYENIEKIATEFNLEIVGPALQYSGEKLSDGNIYSTPKLWMDAFIAEYKKLHNNQEPRYDYFCLHCYMNWPGAQEGYLKEYYDGKSAYNKPIWLTEFCAWEYNNGGQNESISAQTTSMAEKVKFMDGYDGCTRYAWFMSSQNTTTIPFNSLFTKVNSDGSLTTLGQSYLNIGNDVLLESTLSAAKALLDAAKAGENVGEYPQKAIDTFKEAYEKALALKSSASSTDLRSAYKDLESAIKAFDDAKIKPYTKSTKNLTANDFANSLTKGLAVGAFNASSTVAPNTAKSAFDGNISTRWESSHSDDQWLSVDFGEEKEFNTFRFKWEAAYSTTFSIEVFSAGSNWTSILDISDCSGGSETYKLTATQKSRYVRFYGKTRATNYGHSFYEWGISNESASTNSGN